MELYWKQFQVYRCHWGWSRWRGAGCAGCSVLQSWCGSDTRVLVPVPRGETRGLHEEQTQLGQGGRQGLTLGTPVLTSLCSPCSGSHSRVSHLGVAPFRRMGELASTDGGVGPFPSQLGLARQGRCSLTFPSLRSVDRGRSSPVWGRPPALPGMGGSGLIQESGMRELVAGVRFPSQPYQEPSYFGFPLAGSCVLFLS